MKTWVDPDAIATENPTHPQMFEVSGSKLAREGKPEEEEPTEGPTMAPKGCGGGGGGGEAGLRLQAVSDITCRTE